LPSYRIGCVGRTTPAYHDRDGPGCWEPKLLIADEPTTLGARAYTPRSKYSNDPRPAKGITVTLVITHTGRWSRRSPRSVRGDASRTDGRDRVRSTASRTPTTWSTRATCSRRVVGYRRPDTRAAAKQRSSETGGGWKPTNSARFYRERSFFGGVREVEAGPPGCDGTCEGPKRLQRWRKAFRQIDGWRACMSGDRSDIGEAFALVGPRISELSRRSCRSRTASATRSFFPGPLSLRSIRASPSAREQFAEGPIQLRACRMTTRWLGEGKARDLLEMVDCLSMPVSRYPHQSRDGQRQRIAMPAHWRSIRRAGWRTQRFRRAFSLGCRRRLLENCSTKSRPARQIRAVVITHDLSVAAQNLRRLSL